MKRIIIKDENSFLGALISIANNNHDCDYNTICKSFSIDAFDMKPYLESLNEKRCLCITDTQTIHLFPTAYGTYISPAKRIGMWLLKLLVLTVKNFVVFGTGVATGIAIAYFTMKFGLR